MFPSIDISLKNISFTIYTYNIFIAIGLISGFLCLDRMTALESVSYRTKIFMISTIALIVGAIFSNRITIYLLSSSLSGIFSINNNSYAFSFLPGLICSVLLVVPLFKILHVPILKSLNILAAPLVLAHGFGRVGCFFAGCCFGHPTKMPVGVIFPRMSPAALKYGYGVSVHPTQLYEAGFLFILFYILSRVINQNYRTVTYLLSYGLFRFFIEFLRGDERGFFLITWASPSQIISFFMIFLAPLVLYKQYKMDKCA